MFLYWIPVCKNMLWPRMFAIHAYPDFTVLVYWLIIIWNFFRTALYANDMLESLRFLNFARVLEFVINRLSSWIIYTKLSCCISDGIRFNELKKFLPLHVAYTGIKLILSLPFSFGITVGWFVWFWKCFHGPF